MPERVYQSVPHISLELASEAFASGNPQSIADALLRLALHFPDWRLVQAYCIQFSTSPNRGVRMIAAQSLGHLARLHRQLDIEVVMPVLKRLMTDPKEDPLVSGTADSAIDDIAVFLKRKRSEL